MKISENIKQIGLRLLIVAVVFAIVLGLNSLIYKKSGNIQIQPVQAGESDNVFGFAWSENVGWVSFNCKNNNTCETVDYGVNIDLATGELSGHAWSENLGWISFNRLETNDPPSPPYKGSGAIAKYNYNKQELDGWFRVLSACDAVPCADSGPGVNSGGWDGWIRFCDDGVANCSGPNQIATIDGEGNWHGWAWSDAVVGWLSFNSEEGPIAYSVGSLSGVVNRPPDVSGMAVVPHYGSPPVFHSFSWVYSDLDNDNQIKFEFQVADNVGFSPLQVDWFEDKLNNPSSTTNTQSVFVVGSPELGELGYNTPYYWHVRVWDAEGNDSGWIQGSSFTTESHYYPTPNFSWSIDEPSEDEPVQFLDDSTCYDASNSEIGCSSWLWIIPNATYEPGSDSSSQNPIVKFSVSSPQTVTLEVRDPDGFTAVIEKNVNVRKSLPEWQEIAP